MQLAYIDDRMLASVDPDAIGLAPMPTSPRGTRGSELNCDMMGLFAGVKDRRTRDAAWKYIRFYDGEEAQQIRTRVFVENGYGQFIPPDRLRRFGYGSTSGSFLAVGWRRTKSRSRMACPSPTAPTARRCTCAWATPGEGVVEGLPRMEDAGRRLARIQRPARQRRGGDK